MNRFSIRDIENLTGIKAHTLRIWEQRYGILQPKRTPTNIRYYDADDLKLALRITLLNTYGYKISRIHRMSGDEMIAAIGDIRDKGFRIQAQTNELLEAMLAMDTIRLEELLNKHINRHGIEASVEELIFRFLEKIGLMWLTDRLFPAQEHLVSNIISRKIAVAIESLPTPDVTAGPSVLLFLPEGEVHDLALCYVHYLLRKYGKMPIYLGQNTPLKEAALVHNVRRPQYAYIHLTATTNDFDPVRYLSGLSNTLPGATVFVSGALLRSRRLPTLQNVRYLLSLEEVRETLVAL